MRIRIKNADIERHVGDLWGACESVYLMKDGSYQTIEGEPVAQCKYCDRFIRPSPDMSCDGCWEVTHRLGDFIKSKAGRNFVLEMVRPRSLPPGIDDSPLDGVVIVDNRLRVGKP